MPSTPTDLLDLSKQLHALNGNEALQRCVVSRAYYATLHAADETFEKVEGSVRAQYESSHAEIINRVVSYGKSFKPGRSDANLIAQALPRLRKFRNSADYKLAEPLSPREYSDVVQRAQRVLALCADVVRSRAKVADSVTAQAMGQQQPEYGSSPARGAVPASSASPETERSSVRPTLKRVK